MLARNIRSHAFVVKAPTSNDPHAFTRWQRAQHREIARRYAWRNSERLRLTPAQRLMNIRLREIEDACRILYGPGLPNTPKGRGVLEVAFHTIAGFGGGVVTHCVSWARMWARWLPAGEAKAIAARVAANPMKFTADTVAWRIGLTDAIRTRLDIRTIGAIDMNKRQRAARRKERDRIAKAQRRRAKGAKLRVQYEAESASRTKPWEAFGICRRTWEARGKPMRVCASASAIDEASLSTTNLRKSRKPHRRKAVAETERAASSAQRPHRLTPLKVKQRRGGGRWPKTQQNRC